MSSVAVVIVSYNSGSLLERCLQAVSEQTRSPDRVIVIDNASTDAATLTQLESLAEVEVIFLNQNLGYGAAINRASTIAEDVDYLCCLNPDTFLEPRCLEMLMKSAQDSSDCGSFAPLMLSAENTQLIDGAGDVLHLSGIPWRRLHGVPLAKVALTKGKVFSACGGAALYYHKAFREIGGFDESFFMYIEDIDLGFRLQLAGYQCEFVPDAVALHVGSATTGRDSAFSFYHGHRNLVWNYAKNMPTPILLLSLPLHIIATAATLLVAMRKKRLLSLLAAKRDAIIGLPERLKKKQKQQRRISLSRILNILSISKLEHRFLH